MIVFYVILYVLASLCFLAYAMGAKVSIHLLGLGVFFWSLVPLIQTVQKL